MTDYAEVTRIVGGATVTSRRFRDDGFGNLAPEVHLVNLDGSAFTGGSAGSSLVETLWTDDTDSFFVRVDNGTAISWTDVSGSASAAPGTGARPAAGASVTADKTPYVAIAGGTGYSINDLIDHYTIINPTTGAVLGNFWLNVTTGAKIAAPSGANIVTFPTGTATSANQTSSITQETAINTVLGLKADTTATDTTSSWSAIALLKALLSKLSNSLAVTGTFWQATQPVSVASLPLPTGASTSAAQTSANTSLTTIATNTGAATPAGANLIGKVGIDQTTPGTTNGVAPDSVVDGPAGVSAALGSATQFAFASGLPVQGGSSNQNIVTTGYGSFIVQSISNASGNVFLVEGSVDNGTTWTTIVMRGLGTSGTGGAVSSASGISPNLYQAVGVLPLMRVRMATFTGGTTTVAVTLKRSVPVNVVDAFVGNQVTIGVNLRSAVFSDTTTPLGASATFTGTSRDLSSLGSLSSTVFSYAMFGATFYSDQAGTAFIDESTDNATWFMVASQAITAGTGALVGPNFGLNVRIRARYYRVRFINGSVLEGALRITSSFTAS